jgi:hypothetical protein
MSPFTRFTQSSLRAPSLLIKLLHLASCTCALHSRMQLKNKILVLIASFTCYQYIHFLFLMSFHYSICIINLQIRGRWTIPYHERSFFYSINQVKLWITDYLLNVESVSRQSHQLIQIISKLLHTSQIMQTGKHKMYIRSCACTNFG